jgi:hypothetical protein
MAMIGFESSQKRAIDQRSNQKRENRSPRTFTADSLFRRISFVVLIMNAIMNETLIADAPFLSEKIDKGMACD